MKAPKNLNGRGSPEPERSIPMRRSSIAAMVSVVALATIVGVAPAHGRSLCILTAKLDYKECKAECKEEFQVAKDACLDRDHGCVEVCRALRAYCRELTGLDAAIATCNATLYAAKQTCRNDNPIVGSPERDQCIDRAQVEAFQCRDDAREAARPGLRQCKRLSRYCVRSCTPNTERDPDAIAACKDDAKLALLDCKAACREDLQVAKDACRNRDHACAEQCRADRDLCKQPYLDQLAADIADCKTTRDGEIQTCKDLYAEGTPERDACIDQAQVVAFQCHDLARENARPWLNGCRDNFMTCITECPPATP